MIGRWIFIFGFLFYIIPSFSTCVGRFSYTHVQGIMGKRKPKIKVHFGLDGNLSDAKVANVLNVDFAFLALDFLIFIL